MGTIDGFLAIPRPVLHPTPTPEPPLHDVRDHGEFDVAGDVCGASGHPERPWICPGVQPPRSAEVRANGTSPQSGARLEVMPQVLGQAGPPGPGGSALQKDQWS